MKIVFFGTSEFGAIILEKLVQAGVSPVLVVTTPDKPAGRKQELTPPPVKVVAQKLGIPVIQPAKLSLIKLSLIRLSFEPELFVVSAYGKILPKEVLDIPEHGTFNVHPSLLPKYRGSSPVQNTILNGDEETGVTIILLDEKMDHGSIISQQEFPISNFKFSKPTYPELHNALAELGAELLVKTIPQWIAGNIKGVPQDDSQATFTAILKKEDGRIDWNNSAEYIERQVRAFTPWPGTFTLFEGKNLKILKASMLSINLAKLSFAKLSLAKFTPGAVFLTADKKLAIQCGKDVLLVEELQLEGKKSMGSQEFLLGHKEFVNTILQ